MLRRLFITVQVGRPHCLLSVCYGKGMLPIISPQQKYHMVVDSSLHVAPSVIDERVYTIVAKSLLSYITSVPNFWNVIYEKLFVK